MRHGGPSGLWGRGSGRCRQSPRAPETGTWLAHRPLPPRLSRAVWTCKKRVRKPGDRLVQTVRETVTRVSPAAPGPLLGPRALQGGPPGVPRSAGRAPASGQEGCRPVSEGACRRHPPAPLLALGFLPVDRRVRCDLSPSCRPNSNLLAGFSYFLPTPTLMHEAVLSTDFNLHTETSCGFPVSALPLSFDQ